jgi:hypothetical protein
MWHVWGTEELRVGFWCGNTWGRNRLKEINPDIKMTLKWVIKITVWEGVDWIRRLRIGTSDGLL